MSKLLGKLVSLFVKILNFYLVSRFLTLEALQVPISFPFSLLLFLLHFHFKLAISGLSLTPLSFIYSPFISLSFHYCLAKMIIFPYSCCMPNLNDVLDCHFDLKPTQLHNI